MDTNFEFYSKMSGQNLAELGEEVSRLTRKITQQLQDRGRAIPSIHDISSARTEPLIDGESALKLAEAARELEALALGPHQALGLMGLSVSIQNREPQIDH